METQLHALFKITHTPFSNFGYPSTHGPAKGGMQARHDQHQQASRGETQAANSPRPITAQRKGSLGVGEMRLRTLVKFSDEGIDR
jgi:hypothetical protein